MFDYFLKYPALWLSMFGMGSILTIGTAAQLGGGAAASTVAAFLVLAGTVGYESLSRLLSEKNIRDRVTALNINQDRLTREVARTRGEVDTLKDDMSRTAVMMQKKDMQPKQKNESADKQVQKSFERMGAKPRASVTETAQKYKDLLTSPAAKNLAQNVTRVEPTMSEDILVPEELRSEAHDYNDMIVSELIHHAVHSDKIEIFAQPIVKLPSRRLVYLEVFARIRARAGVYLAADRYRKLAEQETLMSDVDHLLLLHVLDSLRADARRNVEIGYFMNISSGSLKDVGFMSDLLEFIKRSRDLAANLIFELRQEEFENLSFHHMEIIKGLHKAGCRFSVDNLVDAHIDVKLLQTLNVEFIKLDAEKLVLLAEAPEGETLIQRLKMTLDSIGVALIVEKLENERDLRELLDFEIDFGEGYLFGKPDLEIAYRPKRAA